MYALSPCVPIFKYHQYADVSLMYISSPAFSPGLQTHISKCLLDTTIWMSNKYIELSVQAEILIFPQILFLSKSCIHQERVHPPKLLAPKSRVILHPPLSSPAFHPSSSPIATSCTLHLTCILFFPASLSLSESEGHDGSPRSLKVAPNSSPCFHSCLLPHILHTTIKLFFIKNKQTDHITY